MIGRRSSTWMIQLSATAVSLASGVGSTFQNTGGVFGVAVATAVFGQWHPLGTWPGPASACPPSTPWPPRSSAARAPEAPGPSTTGSGNCSRPWSQEIHRSSGSASRQATASATRLPSISACRRAVIWALAGHLSSPGMAYQMIVCTVYFSLSHKRREDRLDPLIWNPDSRAAIDIAAPEA